MRSLALRLASVRRVSAAGAQFTTSVPSTLDQVATYRTRDTAPSRPLSTSFRDETQLANLTYAGFTFAPAEMHYGQ